MPPVTVVPGMSPFLQSQRESDTDSDGSRYRKVIKDAETNVARLAGVMQNAELELEKAFSRTNALQKDHASKLEYQVDELNRIVGSKKAQIAFLEDKMGNLKESYGEKLSQAQGRISALEQDLRRYKHSAAQDKAKSSDKLQREIAALNATIGNLERSKTTLDARVRELSIENRKLRKANEKLVQSASASQEVVSFDVDQISKLETSLRECKRRLGLEQARNAKLEKKIRKLQEDKVREDAVRERCRDFADMRVPYKEQLRRENELMTSQLLRSLTPKSKQRELDRVHLSWIHSAINQEEYAGSVCGNSWSKNYRDIFFGM